MAIIGVKYLCKNCKVGFYAVTKNQKFCSTECQGAFNKKNYRYEKKMPTEKFSCERCGKEYIKKAATQKYCSNECCSAASREKVNRDKFIIFERDNFKCIYCGRSPAEDGVKLHVDHIYPRILGGEDKAYNLATACEDCNLSKGKSLINAYRRLLKTVKLRNIKRNISQETVIKIGGEGGW